MHGKYAWFSIAGVYSVTAGKRVCVCTQVHTCAPQVYIHATMPVWAVLREIGVERSLEIQERPEIREKFACGKVRN